MQKMYSCSRFTDAETKKSKKVLCSHVGRAPMCVQRAFFDLVPHESVKREQLYIFCMVCLHYNGSV